MKIFSKNSNYDKYYKDLVPYFKKEKNQKYFIIILSIGASILFLLFAINPTLSTIANLKRQITDAKFVDQRLTEKINNLSSLSQQYQEIQEDIPFILDAVPQNAQTPTLVGQIQTIGQNSSVKINNIKILPVILTSGSSTISSSLVFEVSGNSSFSSIQSFIANLTSMQRALSVISIQISKNNESENDLDFVIRGLAYFKK